MSKHSGENTLLQVFRNIKETVNDLKDLINSKQEMFKITAIVDFTSRVLTYTSCTFTEIAEAHARGNHVILDVDIGQMMPNGRAILPLIMFDGTNAVFGTVVYMGTITNFVVGIKPSGSYVLATDLVTQEQISGFTFVVSKSAPTVNDNTVITFVDEG
jgi:hypothetical protein